MNANQITWEEAVQWLRNQPDQQVLVRHCYYDDPLAEAAERFAIGEEWQAVQQLLASHLPGRVLDIGAGRGISSYAFAKSGCTVTALEPDSSALVGANAIKALSDQNNLAIKVVQEYGETLPFPDASFDIVYGRAVLHHARDINRFCQEAARVLKPGGAFIVTREHVISSKQDLPAFFAAHTLHKLYGGENAYLLSEYVSAIKQAGLNLTKTLGSHDSVINYAPTTQIEHKHYFARSLAKVTGDSIAQKIATISPILHLASWIRSRTSNEPGRHYSFLAVKP